MAQTDSEESYLDLLHRLNDPRFWKYVKFADKIGHEDLETFKGMLLNFKDAHEGNIAITTYEKGKLLESLVCFMLNKSGSMYKVYPNFYTSTNEIDQVVTLTEKGALFAAHGLYDCKGKYFLGECKNYAGDIPVTYVGKFCHLSLLSFSRLGIMFSYSGFSQSDGPWSDSAGLAKKFYLSKEKPCERYFILDFNFKDFQLIAEGWTFYQVISKKCLALETDTKFEEWITEHPAECNIPTDLPR